jgi:hypothetical protein
MQLDCELQWHQETCRKKYLNKYCIYVGAVLRTFKEFTANGPYYKFAFTYNEVVHHTVPLKDNIFYAVPQYTGPTENAPKYKYKGWIHSLG